MNKKIRDTELELLTGEITDGRRLKRTDDMEILKDCDLELLNYHADRLRKHFSKEKVDLCTIISGKNGNCGENCKFCAQSAHNHTGCEVYDLLEYDKILKEARSNEEEGVDRFAIVISGHHPSDPDFEKLIGIYERLHKELNISLCASLGFLSDEQFKRLYKAGVRNYHNNIETSKSYFKYICTTHTFEDKTANIRRAQAAGLNVCSGGIIGMGESMDVRIEMAFDLSDLSIRSIPINTLIPIPGTPFEDLPLLSEDEILRTVSIFRFINPEADIRLAAGRRLIGENGKKAFESGASAAITGNMLTTTGSTIKSDMEMFKDMGRRINTDEHTYKE
ncbi:MAG: biotin synthase BioB [Lachnospiraceae bacterium]|nr:biotin synthase BioB [Lachnospiraceae bacterium]